MADSEVNIIIKAVDKASSVMSGINKSVEKVNNSSLGNIVKEMTGFNLSSIGAAGAVTAVIAQVKKAVNETVQYATSVRDMSRLLGISTEDTSRLIQATDDLFISEEKLNAALLAASRQGIDVSVKGLQGLSEQYLALNPGVERAQFLTQKFGRSGADMGKLMEIGAAGIDSAVNSINGSLVLTEKSIQQTEEYKRNLDNLGDSWMALKVAVGNGVIPVLNAFLSTETDVNKVELQNIKTQIDAIEQAKARGVATKEMIALLERLKGAERDIKFGDRFDEMNPKIQGVSQSIQDLNDELLKSALAVTDWETSFTNAKAGDQFDLSLKMIRTGLQELGPEGENAFNGLLLGMGKISPAAVKAYAETQIVIDKIKEMLAQGYSIDIIVNYVQNWQGGGSPVPNFNSQSFNPDTGLYEAITPSGRPAPKSDANRYDEAGKIIPHVSGETGYYDNSGAWHYSTPHANGGSWMIPMGYGYEGYRMPGGQTASGGETVTITPKGKESASQIILTDDQLKKIGEASGNATAVKLMQLGML